MFLSREEKKAVDRAHRSQGIDLFLPGWGTWGGPSVKNSRKKRRRYFFNLLLVFYVVKNKL